MYKLTLIDLILLFLKTHLLKEKEFGESRNDLFEDLIGELITDNVLAGIIFICLKI